MAHILKSREFSDLVKNDRIESARVETGDKGLIVITTGRNKEEHILGAARGGLRYFKSIDGAASVLQSHGITKFDCYIRDWIPGTVVRGFKHAFQPAMNT